MKNKNLFTLIILSSACFSLSAIAQRRPVATNQTQVITLDPSQATRGVHWRNSGGPGGIKPVEQTNNTGRSEIASGRNTPTGNKGGFSNETYPGIIVDGQAVVDEGTAAPNSSMEGSSLGPTPAPKEITKLSGLKSGSWNSDKSQYSFHVKGRVESLYFKPTPNNSYTITDYKGNIYSLVKGSDGQMQLVESNGNTVASNTQPSPSDSQAPASPLSSGSGGDIARTNHPRWGEVATAIKEGKLPAEHQPNNYAEVERYFSNPVQYQHDKVKAHYERVMQESGSQANGDTAKYVNELFFNNVNLMDQAEELRRSAH